MYADHIKLLQKISHRFKYSGIEWDDLMGIANENYLLALKEFDSDRQIKYPTMLYTYIKNAILDEIKKNGQQRLNEKNVEDMEFFVGTTNPEKRAD